jgi:hypothetical protein
MLSQDDPKVSSTQGNMLLFFMSMCVTGKYSVFCFKREQKETKQPVMHATVVSREILYLIST